MDSDSESSELADHVEKELFEESKIYHVINEINPNSWKKLRHVLQSNPNVRMRGNYEETFLHLLCAPVCAENTKNVIPLIYQLVEAGLDVNLQDKEGNTPLHVCAINELDPDICLAFLRCGADMSVLNYYNQVPIDLTNKRDLKLVFEYFQPGLVSAINTCSFANVRKLTEAWCLVDPQTLRELEISRELSHLAIFEHLDSCAIKSSIIAKSLAGDYKALRKILKKQNEVDANILEGYFYRTTGRKWPLLAEVVRLELWECAHELLTVTDVNQEIHTSNGEAVPLSLWILKQNSQPDAEFIEELLRKSSMTKLESVSVLYGLWKRGYSFPDVLENFIKAGYTLSARDGDGLTIRDLILRDAYTTETEELRKTLYQVDKHIIKLAKEGNLEQLNKLLLDGYDYIVVHDSKGKSVVHKAKKEGQTSVAEFLNNIPAFQKAIAEMHNAIELGNFQRFKQMFDAKLVQARDRNGRTLLHKAILYERTFIIRFLLKSAPELVTIKDNLDRTVLHYAICMDEDSDQLYHQLGRLGASEMDLDKNGYTALEYKASVETQSIMREERHKEYGGNVYTLDRYLELVHAIKTDMKALHTALQLYTGTSLDDMNSLKVKFPELNFRPLLFVCIDNDQEEMALALIKQGVDYNISAKVTKSGGEQIMTLLQAADAYNFRELARVIKSKIEREDQSIRSKVAMRKVVNQVQNNDFMSSRLSGMTSSAFSAFSSVSTNSESPPPAKRLNVAVKGTENRKPQPRTNGQPAETQKSNACVIL